MSFDGFTFTNTGVPILGLALAAVVLPYLFVPRSTRHQSDVLRGIAITICALLVLGFLLNIALDDRTLGTEALKIQNYVQWRIYWWQFQESLQFSIVWIPIVILVWISKAQRVEKLKGDDMAKGPNL